MTYIHVNGNIWVEVDEVTMRSTLFDISLIPEQIEQLNEKLNQIPPEPSDSEMLEWARLNYPRIDHSIEKSDILSKIELLQNRLNQI